MSADLLVTCPCCGTRIDTQCEPMDDCPSAVDLLNELLLAGFVPEEYQEQAQKAVGNLE